MSIAQLNYSSLHRILIVDSSEENFKMLSALLTGYFRRTELIFTAKDPEMAQKIISENKPSLIFMDISMSEDLNPFIVNKKENEKIDVVFTINENNPAKHALKLSGISCLAKPLSVSELVQVMDNIQVKLKLKTTVTPHQSHSQERLSLRSQEGITCIDINSIRRLESDSNYTHFFMKSGEKITVSVTLKKYEDILPSSLFYRTHQSHMVNLNLVKKFLKEDGGYALMDDGTSVLVSRRKKHGFLHALTA